MVTAIIVSFKVHQVVSLSILYQGMWVKFCPRTKFMPCSVLMFRYNTDPRAHALPA